MGYEWVSGWIFGPVARSAKTELVAKQIPTAYYTPIGLPPTESVYTRPAIITSVQRLTFPYAVLV